MSIISALNHNPKLQPLNSDLWTLTISILLREISAIRGLFSVPSVPSVASYSA